MRMKHIRLGRRRRRPEYSGRRSSGELYRSVGFIGHTALVLSDVTPTASLLVIGPVVILTAGTGAVLAYVSFHSPETRAPNVLAFRRH